jgi:hypothetical protein|tara:strand:- start:837 stop:1106 length:270 start_codon:yes stop_codon:yes gene_type:complete
MKTGDLVTWTRAPGAHVPGLVLDTRAALGSTAAMGLLIQSTVCQTLGLDGARRSWPSGINPNGQAVLVILPDLGNSTEWFHECELVKVS